ncbi:ribonuclease H-like domain-containing protein [Tanacetum coccineum]|uniref:Ribonuclease H-like domain-containing protein n=1 Tax=Tanacetum coccineum TaxID=301880 RepID=A0ABQ4YCJ2_9ASTR
MSADSAVTYTSVHSEARSWSIPSEDPYEEAARQLLEQDHCLLRMRPYTLLHNPLSHVIRPLSPRALAAEMRDVASSLHHSLHPSGTPPLLPIPLPAPSTSRELIFPRLTRRSEEDRLLTTSQMGVEVGGDSSVLLRDSQGPIWPIESNYSFVGHFMGGPGFRGGFEILREDDEDWPPSLEMVNIRVVIRRERLAYEQRSIRRQDLDRLKLTAGNIRGTSLEARSRVDTLEDTGSSS